MRIKTSRSWGPNVPIHRSMSEVAWQPRSPLMELTGERHSTHPGRQASDLASVTNDKEPLANPGLQGVD